MGFELETNGFQVYAVAYLDNVSSWILFYPLTDISYGIQWKGIDSRFKIINLFCGTRVGRASPLSESIKYRT